MSTVADYVGKTVDILAFQPSAANRQLSQALSDNTNSGYICTGIEKLAQRWTIEFLTPRGSMPYLPNRGSSFINNFSAGFIRNDLAVNTYFAEARSQVATNLLIEESETDDPEDRYRDAHLDSFAVRPGVSLVLNVSLFNLMGFSRKLILPIKVTAGII